MRIELTRQIKFCAGHRLMNHGGKCENLHGHNYVVDITVTGEQTDDVGRVVDFSVIKKLFKGWIDENWDHGFLLSREDAESIKAVKGLNSRIYLMPFNPTAENMALYLMAEIGPRLLQQVSDYELKLARVTVWETDEACATVVADQVADFTEAWMQSTTANNGSL